ncbi:hypothetical protein IFR09_00870 [Pseudomonas syringae]|nr:hypothetical protein [Pseudomonas syringae]MBD8572873.1 hypothetical protein [Pseudomonas syringae]MBD8790648.1 hypothetical protein [Pseudomonas syringae]MBD8798885.1 hypothetical protein [Pseudomonas syringae]MBD8809712.1 hypothetical protein [Pseudomonas syringae]
MITSPTGPSTSTDPAHNHTPEPTLQFTRTPAGEWEALNGIYRVRFEGARVGQSVYLDVDGQPHASVFVWSEPRHETGRPGYVWILDAPPAFAEVRACQYTYGSIFLALAHATSETENVTLVYEPGIRNVVLDRWGP